MQPLLLGESVLSGTSTCNGQLALTNFAMSRMLFEIVFSSAVYPTICG